MLGESPGDEPSGAENDADSIDSLLASPSADLLD
jgi:hypothetical protein